MRLPDTSHRLLIVGMTGSGKSVAGAWHLAQMPFHKMPFVLFNHKRDELIDSIPGAQFIGLDHKLDHKMKPGIYVVHPVAEMEDEATDAFMWRMHARGNIGFYADEGYMIPTRGFHAYRAMLTQGRSLKIPMITNTQRPVFIDRFAISESNFYRVFFLSSSRDRKIVNDFIPGVNLDNLMEAEANQEPPLKEYHSIYRDVGKNQVAILQPAPSPDEILGQFAVKSVVKPRRFFFL